MSRKSKNYNVFISYEETTGLDIAEHLKKALERSNISAFVARRDIQTGRKFDEDIKDVLDTCKWFIVIITANASVSPHVKQEISQALRRAEKGELEVFPCKHEELKDEDIPAEMRALQMIDFITKQDLANKIIQTIKNIKKKVPTPSIKIKKIVENAEKVGVKGIFTNRRFDPEFEVELRRLTLKSKEILMMAISLRDFIGNKKEAKYNDIIMEGIKKGTKFRLLLLNPLSEAAKNRVIIENGIIAKNDEVYVRLPLFRDIKRAANWLCNNKDKTKNKIKTRYSSLTPTVFMIRTHKCTFIEQYHIGSLKDAGIDMAKEDEHAYCLGGYVPILMVDNSSSFAKLMKSHFENAWDKAEEFDAVFSEIEEFSKNKNQKNYRRMQFIDLILKKANDLR